MKRHLKLLFALTALIVAAMPALAQKTVLKGVVNDTDGLPVIGAYVYQTNSKTVGTVTDNEGRFELVCPGATELTASFMGYTDKTVSVAGLDFVEITLEVDSALLEETVVIGYGSVKKSDLTGAVASVNSTLLENRATSNVGQLMQGRMSGVYIVDSGNPQSNVSIKIRGLGTVNNSDPLLVIDGVPMVNMGLNSLNANDIETIDILKDASAAAIYGARGANGVVLITTKKGKNADGQINVSINQGVAMATSMPKLLDASQFAALNTEMMVNSKNNPNPDWADPSLLGKGTDWVDEMINPARLQYYNLSYTGGDANNKYYVSGSYTDNDGIVRSVGYKKLTAQINLDNQVKKWLKFSTNVTLSYDDKTNGDYSMGDVLKSIPAISVFKEDGVTYNGPSGNALWFGDKQNQVGKSMVNKSRTNGYNFLLSESAEIDLFKGLKFKSVESVGGSFVYSESFRPAYDWTPNPLLQSERWANTGCYFSYLADNYFVYDRELGKHAINAMAGSSLQWGNNYHFSGQKKGFLSDTASQFDNGTEIESLDGGRSDWAIASFMGRINYTYADKYMLTATVRYDGSSKFGPGHRWGLFPSFAGAWRVSEEDWFPQTDYINYMKLRVGYGVTGNQEIGDYSFASVYNTGQYSFNGNVVNSLVASKLSNPDVHWEEVQQYNAGVDFSFFKSRLRLSIDGYIKNTNGMLVAMTVPISTGYSDTNVPYTNEGKVKNTGIEITLGSDNIKGNDFYWGSDFNISFNKNRIVALSSADAIYYNDSGFGQYFCTNMVGEPIGAFIGWRTAGIFQNQDDVDNYATQVGAEPGDIRFQDGTSKTEGDGVINEDDRDIIGYPQPIFTASFNNTFTYKQFDMELYFQGVYGNTIFNVTKVDMTSMSTVCNQYDLVIDRWNGEGTSDSMPRAVYGDPNNNTRPSTRYLEDGSYLRLKSLTFGYTLPSSISRKAGIGSLRIYFEGTNLFTLTSYTGFDPEVGTSSIDWGTYPITRTLSLGLDIKF